MAHVVVNRRVVRIVSSAGSGGLVVTARSWHSGKTTTIHRLDERGSEGQAYYAPVTEYRRGNGEAVYAAVFPALAPGTYKVVEPGYTYSGAQKITVFPGAVAEVTYS